MTGIHRPRVSDYQWGVDNSHIYPIYTVLYQVEFHDFSNDEWLSGDNFSVTVFVMSIKL